MDSVVNKIQKPVINNYNRGSLYRPGLRSNKNLNFKGSVGGTDRVIDKFLMSKGGQKILKLANNNPTFFSLAIMTALATTLRPATIMVVPGAKKEDKKYAAMKSIISSTITLITQGLIFYPLGLAMVKAGEKAKESPKTTKFPYAIKTPKFEAYNYFVNNGLAFFVMIAASLVMVKVVAKVMNKIMPSKKPQTNDKQQVEAAPVEDSQKVEGRDK